MILKKMPVALFNGTIVTTNGLYSMEDIDIESAREIVLKNGFTSAIGHNATAEIMSTLFGVDVPINRIQFHQEIGQIAIALKLNERPDEGKILNQEEMKKIGYSLKKMERLK